MTASTASGSALRTFVLDTSVLIDHLRGRPRAATELIPKAIARGDELWSSCVVRAEVLAGMRAGEEAATRDLFRLVSWADVDESVSELIRAAVDSVYRPRRAMSQAENVRLARRTAGAWRDFPETGAEYVERIRGARRLARLRGKG